MIVDEINNLLDNSRDTIDQRWLDDVKKKYPFFTLPLLLAVARGDIDQTTLEQLAIASPDRRSLALITGRNSELFTAFYPPAPPVDTPSTDDTIDRFLDTYGSNNPREIEALNQAIFNPMPDYADILVAQEQQNNPARAVEAQTREDRLIDEFIEKSRRLEQEAAPSPAQQHPEQREVDDSALDIIEQPTVNDDQMLSQSLANLYIAQHKFSKALEIIENINLNFPEKSIYFADQIRYLRKLITLENSRK